MSNTRNKPTKYKQNSQENGIAEVINRLVQIPHIEEFMAKKKGKGKSKYNTRKVHNIGTTGEPHDRAPFRGNKLHPLNNNTRDIPAGSVTRIGGVKAVETRTKGMSIWY